ncbi:hypothetical protein LEM8419_02460 [Neolewinella maritima]|uniref:Outer membrane protein beta-barrel domain-containing protein n=1 Tax=Neolewinella maritima TaxID=1383882 RepID=A0ABN8F7G8_9BACT|nr:hypothetical protein [Neolewinella maritima]CAH1001557.1 hypothetical protein LEM8419_02460 [Neolewinella maritima]
MNQLAAITASYWVALLVTFLCAVTTSGVSAQSPLDVGLHFSPQIRYISSSAPDGVQRRVTTSGRDGLALGATAGGYLEYALTDHWYVRGGIDVAYKRNRYATQRTVAEVDTVRNGSNFISYASIELPVALLYRFGYRRNYDSFLLGVATTLTRWGGDPKITSSFNGTSDNSIAYPKHTVTVFGGYETYLSEVLVLGIEPYVSYVPTEFRIENATTSTVRFEAGISLRVHLDN